MIDVQRCKHGLDKSRFAKWKETGKAPIALNSDSISGIIVEQFLLESTDKRLPAFLEEGKTAVLYIYSIFSL